MAIVECKNKRLGTTFSYDDEEYEMVMYNPNLFEILKYRNYLSYIGKSNKPTQPVGLTDYFCMFANRKDLIDLDLSHWDMSEAKSIEGMLAICSFKNINFLKDWDVSNVTNMKILFAYCDKLEDISGLKDWNINSPNTNGMFYQCDSLFDLSPIKSWGISPYLYMVE